MPLTVTSRSTTEIAPPAAVTASTLRPLWSRTRTVSNATTAAASTDPATTPRRDALVPPSFRQGRRDMYVMALGVLAVAVVVPVSVVVGIEPAGVCETPLRTWLIVFTCATGLFWLSRLAVGDEARFLLEESERVWVEDRLERQEPATGSVTPRYWRDCVRWLRGDADRCGWYRTVVLLQRVAYVSHRVFGYLIFIWEIAGLVWVARAGTCREVLPTLWKTALAYVVLVMSLFAGVVFALGLLLLCGVQEQPRYATGDDPESGSEATYRQRERRGLTLEEIERVSEKRWARSPSPTGDKVEDTDESVAETVCSICLSELALLAEAAVPDVVEDAVGRAGIDMVRQLRRCGHLFHVNCIDPWLATDCTCPLCKQAVDEASSHGSEAQ
ncbi:hypothetical protein CDCA_CDCA19G4670 [Cyanidium caldarium]|uniref:RING-type domain-containing protein n=1 Tax=Cyanidium caldarium TaxID=2771 RepID=A0AAV9J2P3_CYACA|nr:hypothetical protein CDCA_CDCA19G4670 [Cyanidium caldarium]